MNEKIYYFSNYDNQIHNINDLENYNRENDSIEIVDYNGFVIDQVTLHTLDEIIKIVLNK
jgi:hypothetical protein